ARAGVRPGSRRGPLTAVRIRGRRTAALDQLEWLREESNLRPQIRSRATRSRVVSAISLCVSAGSRASSVASRPAAPLLCESELLRLQGGIPEGGDDDQLVPGPLAGLGELEVERLPLRGDHVAVREGHLTDEGPRDIGDDGD